MGLILPENYNPKLTYRETQSAIKFVRETFEKKLCKALRLERVSAPVFVAAGEGLNDDLSGKERKVAFDMLNVPGVTAEIVQSLAKWKRVSLKKYGFCAGEGMYTNMNAIRRDDDIDNLHSAYVDQWDWETVITRDQRSLAFLKETVRKITAEIKDTLDEVKKIYPKISVDLRPEAEYITSQELEDLYPGLTPKERETAFTKKHKTVCIMQIGGLLKSGERHDGRAPDYDDWELNCDILYWCDTLETAVEISSMGIRVDEASLHSQLEKSGCNDRRGLKYHKLLLNGELPLSIGGGIGQSRLCLLLLGKAHIGEVHASVWPKEMIETCLQHNIKLL